MITTFLAGAILAATTPVIVSSQVRANDPTVLDVVYKVKSNQSTVNVRALVFEDGERSFLKVVRPETFVADPEGKETAGNIGDGIAANVEHRLAWKVSDDWKTDLAKCTFEILSSEQGKIPLDLMDIPAAGENPALTISSNWLSNSDIFNALMWYYADGAKDLVLDSGYLYTTNKTLLSNRSAVADDLSAAGYVLRKMGYAPLVGELEAYAEKVTRKELGFSLSRRNAYLLSSAPRDLYVEKDVYLVIDVSGGPTAASYPVCYTNRSPVAGWSDEFKTDKIILRRIPAGKFTMNYNRPVRLTKPFYIGVYQITQRQYELVTGQNPSVYRGAMRPVENVSWNLVRGDSEFHNWPVVRTVDASSFVGRLREKTGLHGIDLPTEAQWEYACRAGTPHAYNNGGWGPEDARLLGRCYDNRFDGHGGYAEHTTVGSYLPNTWGLYDMHGNVCEWCLDWYSELSSDSAVDPEGVTSGQDRVLRGGCWGYSYGFSGCDSSYRNCFSPSSDERTYNIDRGVRLCITLAK